MPPHRSSVFEVTHTLAYENVCASEIYFPPCVDVLDMDTSTSTYVDIGGVFYQYILVCLFLRLTL